MIVKSVLAAAALFGSLLVAGAPLAVETGDVQSVRVEMREHCVGETNLLVDRPGNYCEDRQSSLTLRCEDGDGCISRVSAVPPAGEPARKSADRFPIRLAGTR